MRSLSAVDFTSRRGLLWPPTARDLARILAAAGKVRPRILDHGAGSGLLAALLCERAEVVAFDPLDGPGIGRFHPVVREPPDGPFDLVVSSWMEAGVDARAEVARFGRRILSVEDAEGGCGVKGDLDYTRFSLVEAARWTGPSFEDVEEALARKGRGLPGRSRNVFRLWIPPEERAAVAVRVTSAVPGAPLPWEDELNALGLTASDVR